MSFAIFGSITTASSTTVCSQNTCRAGNALRRGLTAWPKFYSVVEVEGLHFLPVPDALIGPRRRNERLTEPKRRIARAIRAILHMPRRLAQKLSAVRANRHVIPSIARLERYPLLKRATPRQNLHKRALAIRALDAHAARLETLIRHAHND